MSCADTIPKLELMADDELTSEQAATTLSHIDECASCRDQWYGLLALRQAIKDKAASFKPEKGFDAFEEKLINAVRKEDWQSRSGSGFGSARRRSEVLMYVAATLLVGVVAAAIYGAAGGFGDLDKNNSPQAGQTQVADLGAPASLEDALSNFDQFIARPVVPEHGATTAELASLSQQAGFAIKPIQLTGFKLAGAQIVVPVAGKSNMVRLCYTRINGKGKGSVKSDGTGKGNDSIICYQAAGGKLVAKGLNEHLIDGRKICCGEVQDKSIVFIPGQKDNSNEVLLVGTISKSDLMDLVLSSS